MYVLTDKLQRTGGCKSMQRRAKCAVLKAPHGTVLRM